MERLGALGKVRIFEVGDELFPGALGDPLQLEQDTSALQQGGLVGITSQATQIDDRDLGTVAFDGAGDGAFPAVVDLVAGQAELGPDFLAFLGNFQLHLPGNRQVTGFPEVGIEVVGSNPGIRPSLRTTGKGHDKGCWYDQSDASLIKHVYTRIEFLYLGLLIRELGMDNYLVLGISLSWKFCQEKTLPLSLK